MKADPYPLRIVCIVCTFSGSLPLYVVCTSDGGVTPYQSRLPPYPARWFADHNDFRYLLRLSSDCYIISGEVV